MLTRIYGTAFNKKADLEESFCNYLADIRAETTTDSVIEMELFTTVDIISPGSSSIYA